jgi:hypothetical protein
METGLKMGYKKPFMSYDNRRKMKLAEFSIASRKFIK